MLRVVLCAVLVGCAGAPKMADVDVSDLAGRTRPRLWVRVADVAELRARTGTSLFREGLLPLADDLRTEMDAGSLDNENCVDKGTIACESYALLFAFMSLIHTDEHGIPGECGRTLIG